MYEKTVVVLVVLLLVLYDTGSGGRIKIVYSPTNVVEVVMASTMSSAVAVLKGWVREKLSVFSKSLLEGALVVTAGAADWATPYAADDETTYVAKENFLLHRMYCLSLQCVLRFRLEIGKRDQINLVGVELSHIYLTWQRLR